MTRSDPVRLGDVAEFVCGFAFPSERFGETGELPLARIRDVDAGHSQTYYTGPFDKKYVIGDGDLLIAMDGEFRAGYWCGGTALLNQRVCHVVPDSSTLDLRYLGYALPRRLADIEARTPFATVKHLSVKVLTAIAIHLPPLPEQRRIAAILDKADAVRRKRQQTLDLADQFLRSAFLDMFGDPVTNPKGWPVRKLGDCLARKPQIGTIAKADERGAVHVVRVGDLGMQWLPRSVPTRITLAQPEVRRYRIEPGDFLLARAIGSEAHLGKASVVPANASSESDVVFDSHVMRLKLDEPRLSHVFLWHLLKSPGGRAMFMANAGRTAVQFNVNAAQIARMPIPMPPRELQQRFAEVGRGLDKLLAAATSSSSECATMSRSLVRRAFQGELQP